MNEFFTNDDQYELSENAIKVFRTGNYGALSKNDSVRRGAGLGDKKIYSHKFYSVRLHEEMPPGKGVFPLTPEDIDNIKRQL